MLEIIQDQQHVFLFQIIQHLLFRATFVLLELVANGFCHSRDDILTIANWSQLNKEDAIMKSVEHALSQFKSQTGLPHATWRYDRDQAQVRVEQQLG